MHTAKPFIYFVLVMSHYQCLLAMAKFLSTFRKSSAPISLFGIAPAKMLATLSVLPPLGSATSPPIPSKLVRPPDVFVQNLRCRSLCKRSLLPMQCLLGRPAALHEQGLSASERWQAACLPLRSI